MINRSTKATRSGGKKKRVLASRRLPKHQQVQRACREIADALLPKTLSLVLRELASKGYGPLHIRELARRTARDPMVVRRELERLEAVGVVVKSKSGRKSEYRLNPECPVYDEIRMLIIKTIGVVGMLRDALAPFAKEIDVAFVYGSVARGEATAESDVDLMVVGNVSFGDVVSAIASVEKELRHDVNPTVYSPEEFYGKVASGHHFLNAVIKDEKLFIIGGEEELGRLVKRS